MKIPACVVGKQFRHSSVDIARKVDRRPATGRVLIVRISMMLYAAVMISGPVLAQSDAEMKVEDAWTQWRSGAAVAIMRHALAPGTSDPQGFDINDCSTQRNLSEEGRNQAKLIGQSFRNQIDGDVQLYSSEWCRCVDTAELLDLGKLTTLPALNSFFENRAAGPDQTEQLRSFLQTQIRSRTEPVVLVTHQVNISALTGTFTASGDILIVTLTENSATVLARIPAQ